MFSDQKLDFFERTGSTYNRVGDCIVSCSYCIVSCSLSLYYEHRHKLVGLPYLFILANLYLWILVFDFHVIFLSDIMIP